MSRIRETPTQARSSVARNSRLWTPSSTEEPVPSASGAIIPTDRCAGGAAEVAVEVVVSAGTVRRVDESAV